MLHMTSRPAPSVSRMASTTLATHRGLAFVDTSRMTSGSAKMQDEDETLFAICAL